MSFGSWTEDRRFKALALVTLVLVACALASYTYLTVKQSHYLFGGPASISVEGVGEVVAVPDVALFSFSVSVDAATAAEAQEMSSELTSPIIERLKERGVEEKDIQTTSYNLYPKYEYQTRELCIAGACPPREQVLVGYTVSQTLEVKVRDTDEAGEFIALVGENGATNISGLRFEIDDPDALKAEARKLAIDNARMKAKGIAKDLRSGLGRVLGYWENQGDFYPYGIGGDMAESRSLSVAAAPVIQTGENTITVRVNVSYELR